MANSTTELCRTATRDGLMLDGVLQSPAALDPDFFSFLIVHGTGSNFYAPGILESFATNAVDAGHVALRVNTRGHDQQCSIASTTRSVSGGACFERVSDCVLDIAAWTEFLVERGCSKIVLVGHSMGGVKAVYSQAQQAAPNVEAIACLSPPRFSHQHWMDHPQADAFRESYAQASHLIEQGHGQQMIFARQPLPLQVSAEGFVDKYGPADNYDLAKLVPNLRVPLYVAVGEQTVQASPAFDSWPTLFDAADFSSAVKFAVVPGADMNYSNNPSEPFARILNWVSKASGK